MAHSPIQEIRPDEAMELLRQNPDAVLLDVRSTMEFEYVGHPVGAIHVPLMEPPSWQADPAFVDKVRSLLRERGAVNLEATPIMSLCRSGKRSRTAAELLAGSGFTHLYNVAEGFEGDKNASQHRSSLNGWRFRGLPWEQS